MTQLKTAHSRKFKPFAIDNINKKAVVIDTIRAHFSSIFLSGKVKRGNEDWRYSLTGGVHRLGTGCYDPDMALWDVMPTSVYGMDYFGPYTNDCGHGCNYGEHSHGANAKYFRKSVNVNCLHAIERADLLFAWLDDNTAYGTLAEIGYAKGLGKTVWVAAPQEDADLWFARTMADDFLIAPDAALALETLLTIHCFPASKTLREMRHA